MNHWRQFTRSLVMLGYVGMLCHGDEMIALCMLTQVDSQESSRQQRRAEILERLMSLYSGVVCHFHHSTASSASIMYAQQMASQKAS